MIWVQLNTRVLPEDKIAWQEMADETHGGNITSLQRDLFNAERARREGKPAEEDTRQQSTDVSLAAGREKREAAGGDGGAGRSVPAATAPAEGVSAPPTVSTDECPRIKLHRRGVYCKVCKTVTR